MTGIIDLRKLTLMTIMFVISAAILFLIACDQRSTTYVVRDDTTPPPVPTGVTTTTGDGLVWVEWDPIIGVPDLDGFRVWRSNDNYEFYLIATVGPSTTLYEDNEVTNGYTYYYGLSSFDTAGNESDASFNYETAFDTPRPEGFDEVLYDFNDPANSDYSGFDFSREQHVLYDASTCDIFLEFDQSLPTPTFFLWLGYNGHYIQDMGYTSDFDEITYAPDGGWSLYDYVEVINGHTYVIKTWDDHYAKVRVTSVDRYPVALIIFDWGYQIDPGNRELKIEPRAVQAPIMHRGEAQ